MTPLIKINTKKNYSNINSPLNYNRLLRRKMTTIAFAWNRQNPSDCLKEVFKAVYLVASCKTSDHWMALSTNKNQAFKNALYSWHLAIFTGKQKNNIEWLGKRCFAMRSGEELICDGHLTLFIVRNRVLSWCVYLCSFISSSSLVILCSCTCPMYIHKVWYAP